MTEEAPRVTADELQARLALRSLCSRSFGTSRPSKAEGSGESDSKAAGSGDQAASTADADHDDDEPHGFSLFQKRLMGEMEEVLRSGLARRMERLTNQLHGLSGSGSTAAKPADGESVVEDPNLKPLAIAMEKALKGAEEFTKKPDLAYGPSFRQRRYDDPPEQHTMAYVNEAPAMSNTLQNIQQTISKRERQIVALKAQAEKCETIADEQGKQSEVVGASPANQKQFQDASKVDSSSLVKTHEEIVERRRKNVADLSRELTLAKAQSGYYQTLHRLQSKYIRSIDQPTVHYHVFRETGGSFMQHLTSLSSLLREEHSHRSERYVPRLARHPAGEIFLSPPPPPPMGDDRPEIWDISNAIANPYVTDSWPFEPNVLAQRSPEEAFMPKLEEETQEDIDEENRPGPRNPFKGLGARMPRGSLDDDEMPSTSRSL